MNNEAVQNAKKGDRLFIFISAIAIPLLVGGLSSLLTAGDMNIYDTMQPPPLAPPGWLFPIVWTVLYILMGAASYFVYTSSVEGDQKRKALMFYGAQLLMNLFWSTIFFTFGQYLISLIWLLIMWVLILICARRFYQIHKPAGLMMGVLFIWTTFAAYLNLSYFLISINQMPIALL